MESPISPVDLYNPIDDQSLLEDASVNKIAVISQFINIKNPVFMSLGCGGGQELVAFGKQYPDAKKIIGLDISQTALDRSRELCRRNAIEVDLVQSSTLSMQIASGSIDAICASHLFHEIYSDQGEDGWQKTVKEIYRILNRGGCVFVRDFAAPPLRSLKIKPITQDAQDFTNYFIDGFSKAFPNSSDSHIALETLLHFKTFQSDLERGLTRIGDQFWHELTESYVPPLAVDAQNKTNTNMAQEEYAEKLVEVMGKENVVCLYSEQLTRPSTNSLLHRNFEVSGEQSLTSLETIDLCTRKMQLVIKKRN